MYVVLIVLSFVINWTGDGPNEVRELKLAEKTASSLV